MSNNILYFLRHAETEKNPNIPAIKWSLSTLGMGQAKKTAESGFFKDLDVVISSGEEKAFQTAKPVAESLGKEIIRMTEFNEVKRGDKFLTKEEFEKLKHEKLEDLDCKKDGGESGHEALTRFESGIDKINKLYSGKNILIVSHGTILALYFAKITNDFANIYKRWQATGFCSWGKIRNNIVERDIVEQNVS